MKRTLENGGATQIVETSAAAQVILDVTSVVDDKGVLSLSSGGRVREYLLTKRVSFNVHDAAGRDWLPASEFSIRRSYTFNESEVLARNEQEVAAAEGHADRRRAADRAPIAGGEEARDLIPTRMELRLKELAGHLERTLAPLYVIHGDEPLFAMEAGDAIRATARRTGCEEREVLVADTGFRWDALLAANANMGLFGARKMIDLRIPSGKPGTEGAKALETCARSPNPDHITLITLPKLERATQQSAWFAALGETGIVIAVYPLDRSELPGVDRRAPRACPPARDARRRSRFWPTAVKAICSPRDRRSRSSALLLPEGLLAHDAVERAVADVSRYDVFELSAACLSGDAAPRTEDRRRARSGRRRPAAVAVADRRRHPRAGRGARSTAGGTPMAVAVRNARVWGKRQAALERAARRVKPDAIAPMVRALAALDALAKGIGRGNPWDDFRTLVLSLAGKPALRAA